MAHQFWKSPAVVVIVGTGNEEQIFTIHEALLVTCSEYFRVALSSDFLEGHDKTFRLERDDTDAFDLFVQYVYTGRYMNNLGTAAQEEHEDPRRLWLDVQTKAYLLGDKLFATEFQKEITANLQRQFSDQGSAMHELLRVARTVYECASATHAEAIRNMLAVTCAERMGEGGGWDPPPWTKEARAALAECGPSDFITDVLMKVTLMVWFVLPLFADWCIGFKTKTGEL